ncbi:hypothetical protein ACHAXN_013043 [Cyclotella atomus]|jgi:FkbM family methyltransferase
MVNKSNWTRKKRGFSPTTVVFAAGGLFCLLMMAYNLDFLLRSSQLGGSHVIPKEQQTMSKIVSDFTPSKVNQARHPMEHLVKSKQGEAGTWELVDWSNPFTPEEEAKFSCNMTEFVAAKSGNESQMCVHSFMEVLTEFIMRDKRWRDCNVLPDLWVADGMKDDDSIYIDIGANIGSCVMEMLMSTKARIIAFEPHPMNVYNIKKTISKLGKEYQDRILLFPVGLGDAKGNATINSGHDNMGNSQIGQSVKDWGSQQFKEHLQFTVFIERMDALLDASAIDKIRFVKMDCQGFECKTVDGMGALAEKMQFLKFENTPKFLSAQGCSDLLDRVKRLGFTVDNVRSDINDVDLIGKRTVS